jgi:hypothetical protein
MSIVMVGALVGLVLIVMALGGGPIARRLTVGLIVLVVLSALAGGFWFYWR